MLEQFERLIDYDKISIIWIKWCLFVKITYHFIYCPLLESGTILFIISYHLPIQTRIQKLKLKTNIPKQILYIPMCDMIYITQIHFKHEK